MEVLRAAAPVEAPNQSLTADGPKGAGSTGIVREQRASIDGVREVMDMCRHAAEQAAVEGSESLDDLRTRTDPAAWTSAQLILCLFYAWSR